VTVGVGQVVPVKFGGKHVTVTTVSGTVSVEGMGISGVLVTVGDASATTDANGAYRFTDVAVGEYSVIISDYPADVTFPSTARVVLITSPGQVLTVDFDGSFIRTSALAGFVMVEGVGVPGVTVTVTGPHGSFNAVTDADGAFLFQGLRAGDYTVSISDVPAEAVFEQTSQSVTVALGQTAYLDFLGTLGGSGQGTVQGTVSVEGTGLPDVTVTLDGVPTITDANGAYQFTSVGAGAHSLTISDYPTDVTFDVTSASMSIDQVTHVATVNFDGSYIRTSSVMGTVVVGGVAGAGITVTLTGPDGTATTLTDAGGVYGFNGLRAGNYTVTISDFPVGASFPSTSQDVTLFPGASEVVNFSGSYALADRPPSPLALKLPAPFSGIR
jgi:hypothetical protein